MPLTKKEQSRRYYLHGKVKAFCKMNVRAKTIFVTEAIEAFTEKQQKYINQLKQNFNYSVQFEIPE